MAKKKKGPAMPESVVTMDDWFRMCGALIRDTKSFEDEMQAWYFRTKYGKSPSEEDTRDMQLEYQEKHRKGFMEDEEQDGTGKYVLMGAGAGLLAGVVLGLVLGMKAGLPMAVACAICAVLGAAAGGGLVALYFKSAQSSRVKRFAYLESQLEPYMKYVPPKYRNSQSLEAFYDIYNSYGASVSFEQTTNACDDYLRSNNLVGMYMAILYDVPYDDSVQNKANGLDEKGLVIGGDDSDPALPSDIKAHVFSGTENPMQRLDELVGLAGVKEQVRQMKNRMEFYGDQAGEQQMSGNHMVFLGPPGTGKTTIARIITKILYDFGYIKVNRCVEVDGGYLKSPYAGQTAERANAIIRYAMGGVLFIDEAYILTEDKANAQGAEAVGVLLKALEDHKFDFVCIMAGYEDNMNRMLSSNEGFASRIKHKIYFDNFSVDEMCQIFKGYMRSASTGRYKIEKSAFEQLRRHFAREREIPGFGNARVIRTTWDSILDIHADRYMTGRIDEDKKLVITKGDVDEYTEKRQKQMSEDGRNFIASRNLDSTIVSLAELKQKTKPGSEDPDRDLAALTGLDVVKDEIKRMQAQFAFYEGKMENTGNHMTFLGPPGTGKTTVAAIMTGYLYKMGLIQENAYLDINGDFLKGMYLGHTGKRTEAVVQYAQGMVLFIDEAYLLTSNDGQADSFGQEAVGVLLDAMEKHRKSFVCIFAGYEKEMQDFLDVNSGLRSRISMEFHFESYTPHELAQMMRGVAKAAGFTVERDVWVPLQRWFKTQVVNPKFGNGRFVRQFFESAKKQHIVNFSKGLYGDDKKYVIALPDVEPLMMPDDGTVPQGAEPGEYI